MWVKLKTIKNIVEAGKNERRYPGDWVDVGRHLAQAWVADGSAELPPAEGRKLHAAHGVVMTRAVDTQRLDDHGLSHQVNEPCIPYPKTLLWNPSLRLRYELLPAGFSLLNTWEVACPIADYDVLVSAFGTLKERKRTQAIVHDLRCLMYDPRLIFLRDCDAARELLDEWREQDDGDKPHAFLRAVYIVKPLICALPVTWIGKTYR
jgi:hypothetical protein